MTSAVDFEDLALSGWRFWLQSGQIQYRAPRKQIREELLGELRARRDELESILASDPDRLAIAPLSYGQRALWLLAQLDPDSSAYNQSLLLYPEPAAIASEWRGRCLRLLQRHPMLRATITMHRGVPIQRFSHQPSLAWSQIDATKSLADVANALQDFQAQPFDLGKGPIARFRWIDGPAHPVLAVVVHHIACDGWSFHVIRNELSTDSDESGLQARAQPSPPSKDYRDFVFWQREYLDSPQGKPLWQFWSEQLKPPVGPIPFPYDRRQNNATTGPNGTVVGRLEGELLASFRRLAADLNVTPSALTLAAFLTLLHRWTQHTDLVIGMPSSGRERAEWQQVVGYFVDPVAVRVEVDPGASFDVFAQEVANRAREAVAHRDLPFGLLAERIAQHGGAPGRAVFNVLFNFLREDYDDARPIEIATKDAKFDLTLTAFDSGSRVTLVFGYRADLFGRPTIEPLPDALRVMIAALSHQPTLELERIPLLDQPRAPQPVLTGAQFATSARPLLHEIVAHHAATAPNAIALCDWVGDTTPRISRRIDYHRLQQEVETIADSLCMQGVRQGTRVGLVSHHSSRFVASLLAIWSLGATAVIIDEALPAAMATEMLIDACAEVLLTCRASSSPVAVDGLPTLAAAQAIADGVPGERERPGPDSVDALAYVVFTSGSTGRPKGVRVSHRSLINYVASGRALFGIDRGASFGLVSPLSADLGYTMLFLALDAAGTLHLFPPSISTNPGAFAACMAQGLDYLKITPSHLGAVANKGELPLPRKALILGGEATSIGWAREILRQGPCRVFNHYGPTEATIGVLVHELSPEDDVVGSTLPLSRAVFNSSFFILDHARQPVPRGMPGILFVAGTPLAKGYLDIGDATGGFEEVPSLGRVYCTGDLVRQRADDAIEILGRADRQLKVHGFRVEPAHIERVIMGFNGVTQCVVVGDREGASASRLIAWITTSPDCVADQLVSELRAHLKSNLPPHMMPAELLVREHLPITRTGKVDMADLRNASVPPQTSAPAPRERTKNAIELRLLLLFRELLKRSDVRATDSFFEIGGHSILALQLSSRIYSEFSFDLPLHALVTNPSVRQIAALIESGAKSSRLAAAGALVHLKTGETDIPIVLLPGAGGSLLYFEDLASRLPHHPVFGVPPTRDSVEQSAAAYRQMILDTLGDAPFHLIGHSFGALIAYEIARLASESSGELGQIILLDNPAPGPTPELSHREWGNAQWCARIAHRIQELYGVELAFDPEKGSKLPEPDLRAEFAAALIDAGVFPRDMSTEQIWTLVATYRDNVVAANSYSRPSGNPRIDIHLIRAQDDRALASPRAGQSDRSLGWAQATSGQVDVHFVPGTHITMLFQPQVDQLAECIGKLIGTGSR